MIVIDIIQRVQSLYSKGVQSDDSRLSPRHIYNKLVSVRSYLLLQQSKKRQKISDWSYQILPCVELIDVPVTDCPFVTHNTFKVKRTKYRLPKPITGIISHNIEWVFSLDNKVKFDESNRLEMLHIKGNRFTANLNRFIPDDGYLYIYGKQLPEVVKVKMLCEDPAEAISFKYACKEDNPCYTPLEMEFPIETGYIDLMLEMVYKELVELFNTQKEDVKTNANDLE